MPNEATPRLFVGSSSSAPHAYLKGGATSHHQRSSEAIREAIWEVIKEVIREAIGTPRVLCVTTPCMHERFAHTPLPIDLRAAHCRYYRRGQRRRTAVAARTAVIAPAIVQTLTTTAAADAARLGVLRCTLLARFIGHCIAAGDAATIKILWSLLDWRGHAATSKRSPASVQNLLQDRRGRSGDVSAAAKRAPAHHVARIRSALARVSPLKAESAAVLQRLQRRCRRTAHDLAPPFCQQLRTKQGCTRRCIGLVGGLQTRGRRRGHQRKEEPRSSSHSRH